MSNFNNIPTELQQLNHWVAWSFKAISGSKPTKVPHGSVNDPSTWVSFKVACETVSAGKADGIGFVFSDLSAYAGIDLDHGGNAARQQAIFAAFNSYSEISPSGQGLHIIVKGKVGSGRRREYIEIYSSLRYFTFTGNVYDNHNTIEDRQELLTSLWVELGGITETNVTTINEPEQHKDQEVIQQALLAENGDKFELLNEGKWQNLYPSQSEADLSFINIIGFYTKNREQIVRIFRASPLGQRPKAKRDVYVNKMIDYAFDKQLPLIDMDELPTIRPAAIIPPTIIDKSFDIPLPEGLLGEIAQFIYQAAPRPVKEIALAGAIGLMAGICGRAYNVSRTGVNVYILLLADTGVGKESIASGIGRLMESVRQQVPSAMDFIGPSEIASGPALLGYLSKTSKCFVSILGEFGLHLAKLTNPKAANYDVGLRKKLLDLYNKSGFTDIVHPYIYADSEKNLQSIQSPAFSICAESTPDTFFDNINEDMVSEGMLPRFVIINYPGKRVELNDNHGEVEPSFSLIEKLVAITANALAINNSTTPRKFIKVEITDEAKVADDKFEKLCTNNINNSDKGPIKQIWNRAHLNMRKISALYAIGVNPYHPVIEEKHIEWTIKLVTHGIELIIKKYEGGDMGDNTGELKQIVLFEKMIEHYITTDFDKVHSYMKSNKKAKIFFDKRIIPKDYIVTRMSNIKAFKNDKMGTSFALNRCINVMIDKGAIQKIPEHQLLKEFGVNQTAFKVPV